MKRKIFNIIQIGEKTDLPSRAFDDLLVVAILSNIAVMFLSTFQELSGWMSLFHGVEAVTMGLFIAEYALRIWTADLLYPGEEPARARLHFVCSFEGVIDLLTILPAFFLSGFVVLRLLRVVRIFRLFQLNAQYDSFNVIAGVVYEKRNQILSSVFIIMVLMFASSLCMYNVEHEAQPEVFKNAFSGLWWSMSTLLTVGYGDIYPVTVLGQAMAMVIAFLGVGAVAIPTGIISAGFVEQYNRRQAIEDVRKEDIADIVELTVQEQIYLEDYREKTGLKLYLVLRGDMSILPTSKVLLLPGDIVIARAMRRD